MNQAEKESPFEALCVVNLESLALLGGAAVAKLSKFCRDSALSVYVVSFMRSGERSLFLTKQRLIPSTAYSCAPSHLGERKFAGVDVLVANTVKRLMPKSDSKFIDKFAQLLEPGFVYVRQVSSSHVLYFRLPQAGSLEFWHDKVPQEHKTSLKASIKPRGLFTEYTKTTQSQEPSVADLLSTGETFFTSSLPLKASEMTQCQINPPNILCSLWNQPPLVVQYFQDKALEGNKEEGECQKAEVIFGKPPADCDSFSIQGFGTILIPSLPEPLPAEPSQETHQEKDKLSSMNLTCESTPEQPRGFASRLSEEREDDSVSQDQEDQTSRAIAQTMALISSGHKFSVDDSSYHMALFRQLKRQIVPGRRFTLF